ncbi:hypothetical protein ACHAWF_012321 [Thalassiosira exigua]
MATQDPTKASACVNPEVKKQESTASAWWELKRLNLVQDFRDIALTGIDADLKTDVIVREEEAFGLMKTFIDEKKAASRDDRENKKKWEFSASPHSHFGKTLDDTYKAFLSWARTEDREKINVSKALRRLESYADFMHEHDADLAGAALTAERVKDGVEAWAFKTSVNSEGRLVWWVDSDEMNPQNFTRDNYLQTIAWYSHAVMYDESNQQNGTVVVHNLNKIALGDAFTLMPPKVGKEVVGMALGVMPIRLQSLYFFEAPAWINLFFMVIGMVLSKKYKKGLVFFDDWSKIDEVGGVEAIPKGWGKVEGALEANLLEELYFSS